MRDTRPRRAGFTLIEMLVVIGLILAMTGLVLMVNLRTADQRKVLRAADQLQGWLLIAKQRAIRDKAPRGVQITLDPNTGNFSNLVYMEQPEPWTPELLNAADSIRAAADTSFPSPPTAPAGAKIRVPTWDRDLVAGTIANSNPTDPRIALGNWRNYVFLSAGVLDATSTQYLIYPGDTLEILEPPSIHQIANIWGPGYQPVPQPSDPSGRFLWYQPFPWPSTTPPYPSFPSPSLPYPQPGTAPLTWMLQLGSPPNVPPASVFPVPLPGNVPTETNPTSSQYGQTNFQPNQPATWQRWLWATANFRIIRRPQPLVGEAMLQMARETAIMPGSIAATTPSVAFTGTVANGQPVTFQNSLGQPVPLTIMFGPDGRVSGLALGNNPLTAATGNVILWVYDTQSVAEPTLIVIYSRTGLIANHPVDTSNAPFSNYNFTTDGQPSGL